MNIQRNEAAPSERRYTIGPIIADLGDAGRVEIIGAEEVRLSPRENDDQLLEAQMTPPEVASTSTGLPDPSNEAPDEDLDSNFSHREAQQLLLWSAAPDVLEVPVSAQSTGGEEGAKQQVSAAASPSEALLHSLGDEGLRSAMRRPTFLPQREWLRHLLEQAVEDAQLLFSSLWDACTCKSLGLPRTTCPDTQLANALDPVIAFAACGPSAPKRRLAGGREEAPAEAAGAPAAPDSPHLIQPNDQASPQAAGQPERAQDGVRPEQAEEERAEGEQRRPRPTAREYISSTMTWATKQLEQTELFPSSPAAASSSSSTAQRNAEDMQAGEKLREVATIMVRRLLRCYAHVYLWHMALLQQHGAVAHANRCLKRLMFLAVDAQLLEGNARPLEPIRSLADAWLRCDQSRQEHADMGSGVDQPESDFKAGRGEAEDTPGDWLVPALEKAEVCLRALDEEECPSFGTEQSTKAENAFATDATDRLPRIWS
ncbi:hypothetical protein Esti_001855 [Eimeria stiedai]